MTSPLARDEQDRKRCRRCLEWVPLDGYQGDASRADGLCPYCNTCKSRERISKIYGIPYERYEQMLADQGGGCAVCQRTPQENGKQLAVDHDHSCCPGLGSCGKCVRGLLCKLCNVAIGQLHEDVDLLYAAIRYLLLHGKAEGVAT